MSQTKAQLVGGVGISTVGDLSVYGGVNATGVITATSFVGSLTGTASTATASGTAYGLSGTPNINVGFITATGASISGNVDVGGNVSIAGTLTYEDVTNIDSIGIVTARSGIILGPTANTIQLGTGTTISSPGSDTFTISTNGSERVRVDSSGRLAIATTGPASRLTIKNPAVSSEQNIFSIEAATSTGTLFLLSINQVDDNTKFFNIVNGPLSFGTNNTERARIDSSGRLLVGTSTNSYTNSKVEVFGGLLASSEIASRIYTLSNVSSANPTTVNGSGFNSVPVRVGDVIVFPFGQTRTVTAVVSDTQLTVNSAWTISFAGSNVTGYPSLVFSTTADGASSPTERMRITNGGNLLVGQTSGSLTSGGAFFSSSTGPEDFYLALSNTTGGGGSPLYINREGSDGTLVTFRQANTTEGVISVSGSTVTYGGGHLARWSQLPNDEDPSSILKGTVMSNLDEMCEWGEEDNEQLNRTKISDTEGDPNVAGVFVSTSFDNAGPLDFFVGMTGDMIIRIAEGVTVQRGDLLMSAGDGTAKPQDDDIIRSKTIAKVTSTHVACTYDDGSYCVPCVLMAC